MKFSTQSILLSLLTLSAQISLGLPDDLQKTIFSEASTTPCPAALCASASGDVYVAVDLNGSLGKKASKGRIVKLKDTDNDGQADEHTIYAEMDNVRGLLSFGKKLYVLHTVIPKDTGILSGMHLTLLEDNDGDGQADGEGKRLISHVSTLKHNQERGADHTTNGIQMGIDGWIYIAVGDFGFVKALGSDGTELTKLGGGILRVRPDGSEMEMYTHGLRNIYDVTIDPFMNIFTRGNNNDGGGWNIRFIHHIQSANYGYPMLFKGFTDEILPALVDVGGGSGVGSLYFQEPGWPEQYNNVPWMADWGRSMLFIHRVTPDGASFTQQEESFISTSQITDVDVDGSGRVYLSAWDGAGYKGNDKKGFIERVTPKTGWEYTPFPKINELDSPALIELLISKDSAKARITASQELIERNDTKSAPALLAIASDKDVPLEGRVAALFTYAQLGGERAINGLVSLTKDVNIQEFALRALSDRKPLASKIPVEPFLKGMDSTNPRIRTAATIGLGRLNRTEAIAKLIAAAKPPKADTDKVKLSYFQSPVLTGAEQYQFDIPISVFREMFLIAKTVEGTPESQIIWQDATIHQTDKIATAAGEVINKKKTTQNQGETRVNLDAANQPIQGISSSSSSVISLNLGKLPNKRLLDRFQATVSLSGTSDQTAKVQFYVSPTKELLPPESPHATPNSAIIQPHLAVTALVELNAVQECLQAIDGPSQDGVLWALRLMHQPAVVDGLISKYNSTDDHTLKLKLYTALARLYTKEAPYDGSWWWKTKPDTRGPYYVPVQWDESSKIEAFLIKAYNQAGTAQQESMKSIAAKHRIHIEVIDGLEIVEEGAELKGEVGRTSIEDIILGLEKKKGDALNGGKVINQVGCIGCHNTAPGQPVKAPDLTKLHGQDKYAIAESILRPGASIAKSWVNLAMQDGSGVMGTLVQQNDADTTIHNIAGIPTTVKTADIKETQQGPPLMTMHLVDDLSIQELADLIAYMQKISQPK